MRVQSKGASLLFLPIKTGGRYIATFSAPLGGHFIEALFVGPLGYWITRHRRENRSMCMFLLNFIIICLSCLFTFLYKYNLIFFALSCATCPADIWSFDVFRFLFILFLYVDLYFVRQRFRLISLTKYFIMLWKLKFEKNKDCFSDWFDQDLNPINHHNVKRNCRTDQNVFANFFLRIYFSNWHQIIRR